MSTLKTTVIQNPSSGTANITLGTSGQVTFGGAVTGSGMDLIRKFDFTNSQGIIIDNCFSSTYEHYQVLITAVAATAIDIRLQFRSGGATVTASNYVTAGMYWNSGGVGQTGTGSSQSNMMIGNFLTTDTSLALRISSPYQAKRTTVASGYAAADPSGLAFAGGYNATTQMEGFLFWPNAGYNLTGSVAIYGYKYS